MCTEFRPGESVALLLGRRYGEGGSPASRPPGPAHGRARAVASEGGDGLNNDILCVRP